MSARDDYPRIAAFECSDEAAAALDEIDRLRSLRKSDEGAYEHVCEMLHTHIAEGAEMAAEIDRLRDQVEQLNGELSFALGRAESWREAARRYERELADQRDTTGADLLAIRHPGTTEMMRVIAERLRASNEALTDVIRTSITEAIAEARRNPDHEA